MGQRNASPTSVARDQSEKARPQNDARLHSIAKLPAGHPLDQANDMSLEPLQKTESKTS
ncbi:MAG: hypothetical protein ABF617_08050 [Gluconobacter japonicus]